MAEQFGTSRNAVREALRALEHAGLITLQKGAHGGAFITDGDPEAVAQSIEDLLHLGGVELTDITDARLLIETAIVEAAVARATEADLNRLDENIDAVEKLTRDGDMDAKTDLNIGFHVLLGECTEIRSHSPMRILMTCYDRSTVRYRLKTPRKWLLPPPISSPAQTTDAVGLLMKCHNTLLTSTNFAAGKRLDLLRRAGMTDETTQ